MATVIRKRLDAARERHGLTLDQLAQRSGVYHQTVLNTIYGVRKPQPSTVRKLCRALNSTPEGLGLIDRDPQYLQPLVAPYKLSDLIEKIEQLPREQLHELLVLYASGQLIDNDKLQAMDLDTYMQRPDETEEL